MTSAKHRIGAFASLLLCVLFLVGCERAAAQDPLATAPAGAQSADTPTPSDFPTPTPTFIVVQLSPVATDTPTLASVTVATNTPQPTLAQVPTQALTTPLPGGTTYTVKAGDRLFSIGRQFGVNPYSIAQANNILPPYIIRPGQVLQIPSGGTTPPPSGRTYTVVAGDNLFRISLRFGVTLSALLAANPNITNRNVIFVGQVIKIP
jgi:LysM repeat protein